MSVAASGVVVAVAVVVVVVVGGVSWNCDFWSSRA